MSESRMKRIWQTTRITFSCYESLIALIRAIHLICVIRDSDIGEAKTEKSLELGFEGLKDQHDLHFRMRILSIFKSF